MIQEIQEYIRDALATVTDLDCVRSYIFGDIPRPWPTTFFPACQIVIVPEYDELGSTSHNEQRYEGLINFFLNQAPTPGKDWYTLDSDNTLNLNSYQEVNSLVKAARNELQKTEHCALNGLTDSDGEYVCAFFVLDRVRGSGAGLRANSWENLGSISFTVYTERLKE